MKKLDILEAALAGKHGPEIQKKAEDAIKAAVDQIACMVAIAVGGAFEGDAVGTRKFASGGVVKSGGPFIVGNGDREHVVPVGFVPDGVPTEWREVHLMAPADMRTVELKVSPYRERIVVKGVRS